jgi:thiol-disulfide isomerase/thioredoxin
MQGRRAAPPATLREALRAASVVETSGPMNLPRVCVCLLSFGLAVAARAEINLDDSYDKVIAELGQPTGRASAGQSVILRYAEGSIRLKDGKVVAINLKPDAATRINREPAPGAATAPAATPAPASGSTRSAATTSTSDAPTWRTDYRAALADAKQQGRHVFLLFTGSDWCPWCKRLNAEILSTPEFTRYAHEKFVLVEVDFPHAKPQSGDLKKQNAMLQRAFQIEGYPTVIVLDENGKRVGVLGYQEGGPGPFLKQLKAL